MKQNEKRFHLSPLAKVLVPLLSGVLVVGCNGSSSTGDEGGATTPNPTTPTVATIPPAVDVPQDEGTPTAQEVYLSYMDNGAGVATMAAVQASTEWQIKCADDSIISPTSVDKFGPLWKLTKAQVGVCGSFAIEKDGTAVASGLAVAEADLGKGFYVDGNGAKMEGSRQDGLMASKGLPQAGTNVILPKVVAPGEHAAPGSSQIALQLYDPMGDYAPYDNFSLHLWGTDENPDGGCSGLMQSSANNGWDDKTVNPDAVDEFGPVWYLDVADTESGCFNVIFRNGNNDKLISSDIKVDIASLSDNHSATYMPGSATQFDTRLQAFELAGPSSEFKIDTIGAIFLDDNTLVWKGGANAALVQLMFSNDGQYKVGEKMVDGEKLAVVSGMSIKLQGTSLTDDQKAQYPHLADYPAFALPNLNEGFKLEKLLKGSLIAIASNDDSTMRSATGVQYAGALDALFAEEAAELQYGPIYNNDNVTLRLWAPTASAINLVVYNKDKTVADTLAMTEDSTSGSWSVEVAKDDIDGKFYRYQMTMYQPREQKPFKFEVTDPYSVSLSTNSKFSQAIDLSDDTLKPSGWDSLQAPHSQQGSDLTNMVIYESHVRDFSARDDSTEHKGKYLAFTEQNSVPVDHLKQLSDAGMTHLHLMPVFDIATINENPSKVADIDQPFSKLCDVNPAVKQSQFASYCSGGGTIADAFAELQQQDSKDDAKVEALNEYVRGVDSYNWGYDPFHYTVPEGSYATNAEGSQRILEFREMVQAVKQDIGMNVVVDVVYNHTNASGLYNEKSVLDKIVPLYYQRLVPDTGAVETSTCCDNTAPEHAMFAKLIDDSIKTWVEQYKIDAFRWDLMGHHPLTQMQGTLEAARSVNPQVYFYGEGWNFGEVADDKRFVQATQKHLGGTGIGSFSDRLRDAVRGGSPFESGDDIRKAQGFATGAYVKPNELVDIAVDANNDGVSDELARALHQSDLVRLGMAANLKQFELVDFTGTTQSGETLDYNGQAAGYAEQPWEIQNYVSKHDNQTFWDINMYKVNTDVSIDDRVRMQALGMATVLLGQGMPFNHMGGELLRSKSMQRDSYDYGDWYNRVDFTLQDNNWDKGLPAKDKDQANYELIEKVLTANAQPEAMHLERMFNFYKELNEVRKSTPLLTLPSGEEIINRVDFRNTGPNQQAGLIVMTIDNGASQTADIDSNYDAAVVVINATPDTQTTGQFVDGNNESITLGDFELINSHATSGSIAGSASYSNGQFSVPAWSAAVFVAPRGAERGTGLPVSSKADIPPFGPNQAIYIAGGFNGWTANGTAAAYVGNGIYQATVGLNENTEFKFTFGNWDTSFGCNGGNCGAGFSALGMYQLSMDATDPDAPVISSELVADYSDVSWYIPGSAQGWDHTASQLMTQDSPSVWSFTLPALSQGETAEFKFTGGSWGSFEHGAADVTQSDASLEISDSNGNIAFTAPAAGSYEVSFNILSKEVTISML
ncbi:pullulanase-type alpha-1,6-glucosidase [Vibrio sp.]|uniref:pullulanase-type alpha-1,6-glucosidase n=1 Tax=Vibrio sp. TaxID=678 RepID=UPI003D119A11